MVVNVAALVYGVLAIINIAWPRTPDAPWYDNYIVLVMSGLVIGTGLLYMVVARSHVNGDAPHGDAIPGAPAPATELHDVASANSVEATSDAR
jgi:hypothetical protein